MATPGTHIGTPGTVSSLHTPGVVRVRARKTTTEKACQVATQLFQYLLFAAVSVTTVHGFVQKNIYMAAVGASIMIVMLFNMVISAIKEENAADSDEEEVPRSSFTPGIAASSATMTPAPGSPAAPPRAVAFEAAGSGSIAASQGTARESSAPLASPAPALFTPRKKGAMADRTSSAAPAAPDLAPALPALATGPVAPAPSIAADKGSTQMPPSDLAPAPAATASVASTLGSVVPTRRTTEDTTAKIRNAAAATVERLEREVEKGKAAVEKQPASSKVPPGSQTDRAMTSGGVLPTTRQTIRPRTVSAVLPPVRSASEPPAPTRGETLSPASQGFPTPDHAPAPTGTAARAAGFVPALVISQGVAAVVTTTSVTAVRNEGPGTQRERLTRRVSASMSLTGGHTAAVSAGSTGPQVAAASLATVQGAGLRAFSTAAALTARPTSALPVSTTATTQAVSAAAVATATTVSPDATRTASTGSSFTSISPLLHTERSASNGVAPAASLASDDSKERPAPPAFPAFAPPPAAATSLLTARTASPVVKDKGRKTPRVGSGTGAEPAPTMPSLTGTASATAAPPALHADTLARTATPTAVADGGKKNEEGPS